jgi:hypothetical protein
MESAKVCRVNHVRETKQAKRKREARSIVSEAFEMGNGGEGTTPPSQGQDHPPLLHRGDANQLGHSSAESGLVKLGKALVSNTLRME